jgi:hypothetical protein
LNWPTAVCARGRSTSLVSEIVSRLEDLREPVTLQTAHDLLRNMEHAQMLHITERDRLREFLGESS